ncbi:MAG: short chain dehydrogenase [Saprospiraceae bacterium]|nr:short chain dehydrogenase [Saprospiraceae bacterium]
MKIALIGARGTIGKGVRSLFEENGHEVIGVSRSTKPGINIDKPESIDAFYAQLDQIDAVICAAGSAGFGALDKLSEHDFRQGIQSKLMGQVNLVRKGLEKLAPEGVFVLTGGMLAYSPWPKTSAVAMINAGLEGFVKAAALDMPDEKRILIVHPPLLSETAEKMGMEADPWPDSDKVAKAYLEAVEGDANGTAIFVEGYQPG